MRTSITILFFLLFGVSAFSQSQKFELGNRLTPSVKTEQLRHIQFIHELLPDFWSRLSLPGKEEWRLEELLERQRHLEPAQASTLFPQAYRVYPVEYYNKILEFVSVEIAASIHGKSVVTKSQGSKLTAEQKNLLGAAEMGADILVKVKYHYKQPSQYDAGPVRETIEGKVLVTAVPDTEAEFPGGLKQATDYFARNVIARSTESNAVEKIQRAIVRFTVNEEGRITDVKLSQKSEDPKIDKLLLDAMSNMPRWKPATDAKGNRVKQEIVLPFGRGGC